MQPEQQQVARAAGGDEDAFRVLWSAHRDAVYRFACWMLQDSVTAEDVVQECFLALIEHPTRFDPARAFLRTFLLAIARNRCRSRWRELTPEVALRDHEPTQNPQTLERLAADEASALLNAAVANLPALQREALFLFGYEGLTLERLLTYRASVWERSRRGYTTGERGSSANWRGWQERILMETDPELQSLIQRWSPPGPSTDLDRRMFSSYRRARGWRSKWNRLAQARISIPIPMLAVVLLVVGCLFFLPVRKPDDPRERMGGFEPVASPQLIVTRAEAR